MAINILCMDLDGTIINCEERYYAVYRDGVLQLGGTPMPKLIYWGQKRNKVRETDLLRMSNVDEQHHDVYNKRRILSIESRSYLEKDIVSSDIHNALHALRGYFQRSVLITLRRNHATLLEQLDRLNISQYFDDILTGFSDEIPAWKVKVDLFASNVMNNVSACISGFFVGDTEVDILAGKEIGLKTIAISSGIRAKEILQNYDPDYIVKDINSVLLMVKEGMRQ